MTIRPLGGYIGPNDDIVRWRFGNTWFVTADDPDYAAAANWHRARFVPDENDPPGEWRNRSEEAPEGGFEGPPCGNISWWDGEGKNVLTWQGPFGRLLTPSTSSIPPGYYSAISPDNEVYGDSRAVRWINTLWDGGRRLTTPLPVIGACKQNGVLIAICTLPLASPSESVRLFAYTYEDGNWIQRIDYSHADLLYPATIATANRAGTEARIIMQINPPGALDWFPGALANRELVFNLTTWSVSVGRDFDPDAHPRDAFIDDGDTRHFCGDELMAVDWDNNDNRVEMWLSIYLQGGATPDNAGRYFRFVGGAWDGLGVSIETFAELTYHACLDLRAPLLLFRQLDFLGQHKHWWLSFNDTTITEPVEDHSLLEETIPGCVLVPFPGYPVTYNAWTRWINVESALVQVGVPNAGLTGFECAALASDGRMVVDGVYRVIAFPGPVITDYRIAHMTDATDADDPGPEFGLAPGASVNPIRFGYRK